MSEQQQSPETARPTCTCELRDRLWNPNTRRCERCGLHFAAPAVGQQGEHSNDFQKPVERSKEQLGDLQSGPAVRDREDGGGKNDGLPTRPGYYWAKWKIPADGTRDGEQFCPSDMWEIVQVNDNNGQGDEALSVAVAGVDQTQWPDCFVWGEFVSPLEKRSVR